MVKRFSGEPQVALLQASQLQQAGRKDEAKTVLDGLLPKAAGDAALRLKLAEEYDRLGDPAAASRAMGQGPQDTLTYGLRAQLLAKADDKQALDALYEELKRASTGKDPATAYSPERRLLLGQMAEFLERREEALTWYRSVPAGEQRAEAVERRVHCDLFGLFGEHVGSAVGQRDEARSLELAARAVLEAAPRATAQRHTHTGAVASAPPGDTGTGPFFVANRPGLERGASADTGHGPGAVGHGRGPQSGLACGADPGAGRAGPGHLARRADDLVCQRDHTIFGRMMST